MPAHGRSKNGIASLAYVAGIHVLLFIAKEDVDGRNKSGHDEVAMPCHWNRDCRDKPGNDARRQVL
jgi:hypothetical protein